MSIVRPEDFNCPPVGQDCSQAIMDALAAIDATGTGGTLRFSSRIYDVPDGITESVRGLAVEGEGNGDIGPGAIGRYGTILRTTAANAIAWHHTNDNPDFNDYRGLRMSNLSLLGNSVAAGGLLLNTNYNSMYNVRSLLFTKPDAFGFKSDQVPNEPNDDSSWNTYVDCKTDGCWIGFHMAGQDGGSEVIGCTTIKTNQSGITGSGIGMLIEVGNVSVVGGKNEGNELGMLITSSSGVVVSATRSEGNRIGYKLYRPAGFTHGSRYVLSSLVTSSADDYSLWIGPHNNSDRIIGFTSPGGSVADLSGKAIFVASDMQNFEQDLGSEELDPVDQLTFGQKKT